jgi:hypothetical protein
MLALTCIAWGQRPSEADAAALIERSRQRALAYTLSLPDFVCTELVHRYTLYANRPGSRWTLNDLLTIKLRYLQKVEEHKLELINGNPTDRKYEDLSGAIGSGEFGGVLRTIFEPDSQAVFDWQNWKSVRKRRVAVYEYAVSAAHSRYALKTDSGRAIVSVHGALEIDSETGEVLHLTYIAYDVPRQLNLESAVSTVDYDFADVGGRQYLLPARSEAELHSPALWVRNKIEFREYRKFSADSIIDFGTGK